MLCCGGRESPHRDRPAPRWCDVRCSRFRSVSPWHRRLWVWFDPDGLPDGLGRFVRDEVRQPPRLSRNAFNNAGSTRAIATATCSAPGAGSMQCPAGSGQHSDRACQFRLGVKRPVRGQISAQDVASANAWPSDCRTPAASWLIRRRAIRVAVDIDYRRVLVESAWSAVPGFLPDRFSMPPSRNRTYGLAPHPALHTSR